MRNKKLTVVLSTIVIGVITIVLLTNSSHQIGYNAVLGKEVIVDSNSAATNVIKNPIQTKVGIEKVQAALGETITIPVVFTYTATTGDSVTVILGDKTNQAIMFSPSASIKYSLSEKQSFLTSVNLPSDVVDLYSLESFSKNSITLSPGQSATVDMYIHIPNTWPTEMLKEPVTFNVNHHLIPPVGEIAGKPAVEVVVQ